MISYHKNIAALRFSLWEKAGADIFCAKIDLIKNLLRKSLNSVYSLGQMSYRGNEFTYFKKLFAKSA